MRKTKLRKLKQAFKKSHGRLPNGMLIVPLKTAPKLGPDGIPVTSDLVAYIPSEWRRVKKGLL